MKNSMGIMPNDGPYPFRLTLDPGHFPTGRLPPGALMTRDEVEDLRNALSDALDLPLPPRRYVEVRLLDAVGVTAQGERKPTWSYEDDLTAALCVGDYVMVPFGRQNRDCIAKVVSCAPKPEYDGYVKRVTCLLTESM